MICLHQKYHAVEVIKLITDNLDKFQSLKFINLSGNYFSENFEFDDSLVKKGIKIRFDYEKLPLTKSNWKNYCAISTGLPIDFSSDQVQIVENLILKAETTKGFLDHITDLTIENMNTVDDLNLLIRLLDCLPNLKTFKQWMFILIIQTLNTFASY